MITQSFWLHQAVLDFYFIFSKHNNNIFVENEGGKLPALKIYNNVHDLKRIIMYI